jgi:hypothetical protein
VSPDTWRADLREGQGKHSKNFVFGPRIPDFLSRLVALSDFMRLSLRESRTRGCR